MARKTYCFRYTYTYQDNDCKVEKVECQYDDTHQGVHYAQESKVLIGGHKKEIDDIMNGQKIFLEKNDDGIILEYNFYMKKQDDIAALQQLQSKLIEKIQEYQKIAQPIQNTIYVLGSLVDAKKQDLEQEEVDG